MINRAGNKEKAKRVLNENGNLSGMVGMEILYRVIAAITSVLLGAMIAGGIGVVSAVVSAPFKLFGLAGIIIAYVLITPIATLVGAIAGGAVAGPFEVARYRYYLSLRKNGIRPKVTCIFDAFDFFMQRNDDCCRSEKTDGDWQHRWKEADFSYPGCFQSCGSSSGGGHRYVCGLELSAGAEPAGHSGQRPCLCEDRVFSGCAEDQPPPL